MKITEVRYSRLLSSPDYSNTSLGATALVREDEVAEDVLVGLQEWVGQKLAKMTGQKDALLVLTDKRYTVEREVEELEGKLKLAQSRWEAAVVLLRANGVPIPESRWADSMPF